MTGLPMQGTQAERDARALDNKHLANRVRAIAEHARSYDPITTKAVLVEAARRLNWPDSYAKHLRMDDDK